MCCLEKYPAPAAEQKRVSRKEIESSMNRCIPTSIRRTLEAGHTWWETLLDDLCALIGVEEEKWWCKHWVPCSREIDTGGWVNSESKIYPRGWDICPVKDCHAPRPKDS